MQNMHLLCVRRLKSITIKTARSAKGDTSIEFRNQFFNAVSKTHESSYYVAFESLAIAIENEWSVVYSALMDVGYTPSFQQACKDQRLALPVLRCASSRTQWFQHVSYWAEEIVTCDGRDEVSLLQPSGPYIPLDL